MNIGEGECTDLCEARRGKPSVIEDVELSFGKVD